MLASFRCRSILGCLLALMGLGSGLNAQEPLGEKILNVVPRESVFVFQINGIQRVQDRLSKLFGTAVPDRAPDIAQEIDRTLQEIMAGRDLKGLRPDGRILIALADLDKLPDDATLSLFFPIKDHDSFKASFLLPEERKSLKADEGLQTVRLEERPFYLVETPDYAILTSRKRLATAYTAQRLNSLGEMLSSESTRAFLDPDLAIFVNAREINAKYGDQIKTYRGLVNVFLKGGNEDGLAGISRKQMQHIHGLLSGAFHVIEDGIGGMITFEFPPEGMVLRFHAQFEVLSPTNEVLKKIKLSPLTEIGTLPSGQISYFASTWNANPARTSNLFTSTIAVNDAEPGANQSIRKLLLNCDSIEKPLRFSAGSGMTVSGIEVTSTPEPAKLVDLQKQLFSKMTKASTFLNIPLKAPPRLQSEMDKVGPYELHLVEFAFDLDKAVADLPDELREPTRQSMKQALEGSDVMKLWYGTDGKNAVQIIAKDRANAIELLTNYQEQKQPLSDQAAFEATRKHLPKEVAVLGIMEASRSAFYLANSMREATNSIPNFPFPIPQLKESSDKPAYIGYALVLKPEHATGTLFVPVEALGQIRRLLLPVIDKPR
jgi:hypothetical protein